VALPKDEQCAGLPALLDGAGKCDVTLANLTPANLTPPGAARAAWFSAVPALFVVLWSTGFVGAKLGLPFAEPMTFLIVRFLVVAALLVVTALATAAPWPVSVTEICHIAIAGALMHGVYLGGMFASMYQGVDAGVAALIGGLQPLLVAAAAGPALGERVSRLQWVGLGLGLLGVALVVQDKLGLGSGTPEGYGFSVLALLGLTAGAIYQKRFCAAVDLRSGNVIQFVASAVLLLPLALMFESMQIEWTGQFVFALGWLCLALSLGAISLLFFMIRRGAAARVASLFYLTPPVTALMAYFLFGDTLSELALFGMAIAVAGVALVNTRR
jgi:drug/metabolite transporter (DMT)-like permease